MFLCILKINKSNTSDRVGRKTTVYKAHTEILIWFIIIKKVKCLEELRNWLLKEPSHKIRKFKLFSLGFGMR